MCVCIYIYLQCETQKGIKGIGAYSLYFYLWHYVCVLHLLRFQKIAGFYATGTFLKFCGTVCSQTLPSSSSFFLINEKWTPLLSNSLGSTTVSVSHVLQVHLECFYFIISLVFCAGVDVNQISIFLTSHIVWYNIMTLSLCKHLTVSINGSPLIFNCHSSAQSWVFISDKL